MVTTVSGSKTKCHSGKHVIQLTRLEPAWMFGLKFGLARMYIEVCTIWPKNLLFNMS